jgi:TPP-dependent pyruvate/acetoin dehydrogenase alpha subunit
MNTILRALLAGVFALTLLAGCNKSEDAIDNMKSEMGEAVDAAKEAADAVAEETKDAVTDAAKDAAAATKEAASEAKEEAVDAIQAVKDASATNAAK